MEKGRPAGDDFLRSEFNENFAKLDAAVRAVVVVGTGDGAETREIVPGFRPRAVPIFERYGTTLNSGGRTYGGLVLPGLENRAAKITEGGFKALYKDSRNMFGNSSGCIYYDLAVRSE